jgi:hypothetical protein
MNNSSWKRVTQRMSLALSSILLVALLAACGGSGSTGSTGGSTPTPTATPSPTPTPAVTTYTANGYTISYPKDWQQSTTSIGVTFQDAQGFNAFSIAVAPNPGGVAQPGAVLDATLASLVKEANMTNPSPANVPTSASMAGETWTQKGTTGTISKGGLSAPSEIVILATNHPANAANTKVYELIYAGPLVGSTLLDQQIFQAMLASFKFTS